jgi:hypothetical protein
MDLSKCTERITKVGENHLTVEFLLYDAKGSEIVVETVDYGEEHLRLMKEYAEQEKADLIALKDKATIDAKIAEAQVKIDNAVALDTEMKKEI